MQMENNEKNQEIVNGDEANKGVALGICFGAGLGIIVGAIIDRISLGVALCSVIGAIIGIVIDSVKQKKNKHKI